MEIVEVCEKAKCYKPTPSFSYNNVPVTSPCTTKIKQCGRKYIQPPRMPSFAPKKIYRPSSTSFDANTTYHVSYLNKYPHYIRTKVIRSTPNLQISNDKFQDDTTNRLSYQPVWEMVKAKPFIPIERKFMRHDPMQTTTTVREDFGPKYVDKQKIIMPSGNIRFCSGPMDDRTTSKISFGHPGFTKPSISFKPLIKYSPPDYQIANETTQTLSYQPYRINQRELYPWAQKSIYKPPDTAMNGQTTYSKSYMKVKMPIRVMPITPMSDGEWLRKNHVFNSKTCYSDAYTPQLIQSKCTPVIPIGNIGLSDKKMASDTTNKLSYQSVFTEKAIPFRPRQRNMMGSGPIQSTTTNQLDYQYKTAEKSKIIIPCDNIKHSNKPIDDSTTFASSYMNHGLIKPPSSFKPSIVYNRPSCKFMTNTTNKLSYQSWLPVPKEIHSWAKKSTYQRPNEPMANNSIYNMSYAPPGYYIEECDTFKCQNNSDDDKCKSTNGYINNDCSSPIKSQTAVE